MSLALRAKNSTGTDVRLAEIFDLITDFLCEFEARIDLIRNRFFVKCSEIFTWTLQMVHVIEGAVTPPG